MDILNSKYCSVQRGMEEGKFTSNIYTMIKERKYEECLGALNDIILGYGQSRAALSLLAHCSYQTHDYITAADCYEQLTLLCPDVLEYRLYYAQSLYQAGLLQESFNVTQQIQDDQLRDSVTQLQAAIRYRQDDWEAAEKLMKTDKPETSDSLNNLGCVYFKAGKYDDALEKFNRATLKDDGPKPSHSPVLGWRRPSVAATPPEGKKCECGCEDGTPEIRYNVLLCRYKLKDYMGLIRSASFHIAIACKVHPELAMGLNSEPMDELAASSVGNTALLRRTALVELFNIVAATHYQMKNTMLAKRALADMPPRDERELDPVTLHNLALVCMDTNPTEGFEKLQFLFRQDSFPPETFPNLLLLYVKYEFIALAADVLAENSHRAENYLTQFQFDFLEAVVLRQTSSPEAYSKLDTLAGQLVKLLRNCSKTADEKRLSYDGAALHKSVTDYDDLMSLYLPVLMQQGKIYWDREQYSQVDKLLLQAFEICKNDQVWKTNLGHAFFVQHSYEDALMQYYSAVNRNFDTLFDLPAIVVANLCACYVLLGRREQAESMIERVEEAERTEQIENPERKLYHSCIIHLVLGTMYCVQDNFDFGLKHIVTKFTGCLAERLNSETWFYLKRCLLSLVELMAKRLFMPTDYFMDTCMWFLSSCENYGRTVKARDDVQTDRSHVTEERNLVCYEARLLKSLLLQLTY